MLIIIESRIVVIISNHSNTFKINGAIALTGRFDFNLILFCSIQFY